MTLGQIFIPAFDRQGVQYAFRAARPFADQLGASLVVMHVREAVPLGPAAGDFAHPSLMAQFEEKVAHRAKQIHDAAVEAAKGTPFNWFECDGLEDYDYGTSARVADLIVVPCPSGCSRPDADRLIESLLIGSGRPVFILPKDQEPAAPQSFLVGWNGSLEISRALAVTRPLLEDAEAVTVLSVGGTNNSVPEASAAAHALRQSNIAAKAKMVDKSGSVTDTLIAEAKQADADALVLGAYSHSRLRERVLGGVTRSTIREPKMPTILVH